MTTRYEKLIADAKKNITEISPTDAELKSKSGNTIIVDVRDKEEWDEEHIPDAIHLSRGTVEWKIEDKVPDPNTTIICHCGGGGRRPCRRKFAEDGLQKRPFHGRRLQSLESRRITDDEIVKSVPSEIRLHRLFGCLTVLHAALLLLVLLISIHSDAKLTEWDHQLWVGLATLWFFWPLVLALHPAQSARRVLVPMGVAAPFVFLWFNWWAHIDGPAVSVCDGVWI